MRRDLFSGFDPNLENANSVVFQDHLMSLLRHFRRVLRQSRGR